MHVSVIKRKLMMMMMLVYRNVQQFRGGLEFKAHRLLYHSTPGLRVLRRKKKISFANTYNLHTEFQSNYCTFTLILPIKIVLCSNFPSTKCMRYGCFEMRLHLEALQVEVVHHVVDV